MKKYIYLTLILGILASCDSNETKEKSSEVSYQDALAIMNNSFHTIVVKEVIQTSNYSYIKYKENGKDYWGAISKRPLEEGKTYYYREAIEMKNFESKTLNKVFPSIWFINDFSDVSPNNKNQKANKSDNLSKDHTAAKDVHQNIEVEKPNGGYSLAEIFEKKSNLKGTEVLVKGQVVKLNVNIMNTNWVHIQDGTSYNDLYDLTITTNDQINFKVGDVVSFKGKLILNKDFGYGYKYDFLLENAHIQ